MYRNGKDEVILYSASQIKGYSSWLVEKADLQAVKAVYWSNCFAIQHLCSGFISRKGKEDASEYQKNFNTSEVTKGVGTMKYRINKKIGDRISEIGLGSAYIFEVGIKKEVDALRCAYEGGINF